jgi:PQQ-dependent catabolism-associated CXXCW motif protein
LAQATDNNLDRPVVIYCHERCWLSWNAAKRAVRYGYRKVHWYPEGIEGWNAAGLKSVIMEPTGGSFGSAAPAKQ